MSAAGGGGAPPGMLSSMQTMWTVVGFGAIVLGTVIMCVWPTILRIWVSKVQKAQLSQ
jgi:hypothetical protein